MVRMRDRLTARTVAGAVKACKPGKWSDGDGLYLDIDVDSDGAVHCRWVYVFTSAGKKHYTGLGSALDVPLSLARRKRDDAKGLVQAGKNPIIEKKAAKKALKGKPTFGADAGEVIERKCAESRNEQHRRQWRKLEVDAAPLWPLPVDEVDTEAILSVLQSMWQSKQETASRVRSRIEAVLDAARAKGHIPRDEANPARWRGHLDKLLPKRRKLTRGHHRALSYSDVPAFLAKLRKRHSVTALALEFTILTAARSAEALGARWDEIDLETATWTIPADRMKSGRTHCVPLARPAVAILHALNKVKIGRLIFSGQSAERPLSNRAMEMLLRRMNVDATPHGFRSSFRDWAGDLTTFPREVAEAALAHRVVGELCRRGPTSAAA
jgi:integrase